MTVKTTYEGELQFVTYSDSSRGGPRVTFRLADRDELQKFIGLEGRRLMGALVLLSDDETPAEPPGPPAPAKTDKPIAKWLALRCKEPEFQAWLTSCGDFSEPLDEALCRKLVCAWCRVQSRGDIDGNAEAERLFQSRIRGPWSKHRIATGATA